MRTFAAILPAIVILALVPLARAGVVVDEQQIIDQPGGNKMVRARTVMIQGDKQKSIIDNGDRTVITDLEKGTMTMVDGKRKTYVELPFPPRGGMQGAASPTISFKKTGNHDKIIGYSCDEYSGAGTVGGNAVKMTGCFSDSAPGATDYSSFQREMAEKVKGTPMANMGQLPQGVPLRLTITTTMVHPPAAMSPDQANKLRQLMAGRQFVTNTTVSKISTESLPSDSFVVPTGYQKQQLPPMFGGPAPKPVPGPKAPE
ncbi:MAG TPA: DUF4412 domain-containing protein [Candidatus Binataceae bacterium]|nr:DUF4412 domain-containing protein [Candidatus Binataceae bacterium]